VEGQFVKREFLPIPRVRMNENERPSLERDLGLGTSAEEDSAESSLSKKKRRNHPRYYDNQAFTRELPRNRNYP